MKYNLAYHVYPKRHPGTWTRSVDHIVARWKLFTGKKVIAIASDHSTIDVERVMRRFPPDAEFIRVRNVVKRREMHSFEQLMESVLTRGDRTFWCHGKGSTRGTDTTAHDWCDLMFHCLCDYPSLIDKILMTAPIVGIMRRFGNHFVDCPWHYSGTFYWFDNDEALARDWRKNPQDGWGTEKWPGCHFTREEACCLFMENAGDPYVREFWDSTITPAFEYWREMLRFAGLSSTDCSTTDWSRLPPTTFRPLIGLNGCDTTRQVSESLQLIVDCLSHAAHC